MQRSDARGSTRSWVMCAALLAACADSHLSDHEPGRSEDGPTSLRAGSGSDLPASTALPTNTKRDEAGAGQSKMAAPTPASSAATADEDPPLYLRESDDDSELVVMRGSEQIAQLPSFASWPGYERAGMTTLGTVPEYAVVSHLATRELDARGTIASADPGMQPPTSTVHRVMLVRRADWQVLWTRTSEWLSEAGVPLLGPSGLVALHERPFEGSVDRIVVVDLDGEDATIDGVRPLAAPDADGWIAASTPGYGRTLYGFARAGEPGLRMLSERLQGDGADEQYFDPNAHARPDGTFDYISEDVISGELALVHESSSALSRTVLGRSPTGRAVFARGAHSWLVTSVEPDTGNRAPWLRVDADGVAHVLGPEIASERFWQGVVPGDWFAFMEEASIATDGWLNAATGELLRVPQPPAGMQPFGLDHCNSSAQLRDDGRVIAGLRDDVAGGAFLANDDGSFTRIGSPIRGALFVEIRLLGETVVLSAIDHQYRYCPPAIWTTAEPAGPLLRAGQSELLRAGRSLVIEDPHGFGVELDPSGRYAPVVSEAGTVLHDLELGTAEALPAGTRMIGWLML